MSSRPGRRPHGRSSHRRSDPAVRTAVLALPCAWLRAGHVHHRSRVPGRGRTARLRDRRWPPRPRRDLRRRDPGGDRGYRTVRPGRGRRRLRALADCRLAGRRVRGGLLRRAGLVRPLRPRGACRRRRGPAARSGASARASACTGRFRPRVRGRCGARDHRRRLHLLALALSRGVRLAERDRRGRAGGRRHVAALLPRLRAPLLRPEGPVRVGLPTTKEARCPSTSC